MMAMSLWTEDFLLSEDWGLELPFHQEYGLFGDLKSDSHVDGTNQLGFQPQEAVELSPSSDHADEGGLGLDWMETPDLGAYLNVLGVGDARIDSGLEAATLIGPEQIVSEVQGSLDASLVDIKQPDPIVLPSDTVSCADITFDALLSPPDSPTRVAPGKVQQLQEEYEHQQDGVYISFVADASDDFLGNEDFFDFSSASPAGEESLLLGGASELINSPLSVDDVESMLSVSEPSSPMSVCSKLEKDSGSSIIETSPELYKVISTSSLEASTRFSPYSKSKPPKKEPKSTPRRRAPAQPVPEHVISEQVNKKDRKKLQNKNAAIRYRQKKKEEAKGIKSEEQVLEDYNTELKTKVEDLEREIKYMKNLMEEVYKARGLV